MKNYNKVWVKCNVNDAVKFTLGVRGRQVMLGMYGREYMDTVHPGWETPGTQIQMQLWDFMHVMGPITRMGLCDDYGTGIQLEVYEESLSTALTRVRL